MIELIDIAYVRSGAKDIDKCVGFASNIVGLKYQGSDNGVHYLRADHRHHCLAFVEGESGVLSSGLVLRDADALENAARHLESIDIAVHRGTAAEAHSRRVTDFISFDDPWGNKFDLVIGQIHDPSFLELTRPSSGITEFGHICVDATDIVAAAKFWNDNFNVKVSDWVLGAAALMRFNAVHHTLAVFQGDEPGLCHMNFQVDTIDALFRNWNHIKDHNVEIEQGPGRHPQSGAVFLYFKGPEGLTYEYSWNVRLIEDDDAWVPRTFDPKAFGAIDMWGGSSQKPSTQRQILTDDNDADAAAVQALSHQPETSPA
jgi:2,3-dihydroxy-p-cumate/2,3-dihydroxybenzoate 3,4-dioxygenase